jgi:hypothetical protein
VLLNQFHDVIPVSSPFLSLSLATLTALTAHARSYGQGSSIKAVYEDSDQHYAHVYAEGAKLLAAGLAHLFGPPLSAHGYSFPPLALLTHTHIHTSKLCVCGDVCVRAELRVRGRW